ncbi:MBL fold metallo-hydrolase [Natronomonas sp. EA1]|uniref:MBL fold metallo-hydrolase n=1 Tax=Natronomonas sp. EA1 TaxID=3421655 RepID=UPI003EBEBC45
MADVTELIDGGFDITCVPGPEPERIRAFLFDDGTLVDTGLSDSTDALLDGIEQTGVTPERVVITHADGDHIGGLDAVREAYDLEVYLPVGTPPEHDAGHYYGEGDAIGDFVAIHLPGHRGHQHALVSESRGVAVLADALSGADQRGFPAGYFHLPPETYSEDLSRAERSLEKLLAYEFDVGLVFHGSSVLEGARARLDDYVFQ